MPDTLHNDDILIVNVDGSGLRNLTQDNKASDEDPVFSPDGQKIVFESYRDKDGFADIYTMNTDGSELKKVTHRSAPYSNPSLSPDGERIAFSSNSGPGFAGMEQIGIINIDGSNEMIISSHPGDRSPCWSPDGRKIVFLSRRDKNWEIYIMKTDGSEQKNITKTPDISESKPCWSPDGRKIVFATSGNKEAEIYIMNIDGSGKKRLTDGYGYARDPSCQPISKIYFWAE